MVDSLKRLVSFLYDRAAHTLLVLGFNESRISERIVRTYFKRLFQIGIIMHSRLSQKAGFLSLRSRCPNVVIPFDRVKRSFRDQCSLTPPGWGYYHIESTRRLTEMNRTIMSCCDLPNPVLWT